MSDHIQQLYKYNFFLPKGKKVRAQKKCTEESIL